MRCSESVVTYDDGLAIVVSESRVFFSILGDEINRNDKQNNNNSSESTVCT